VKRSTRSGGEKTVLETQQRPSTCFALLLSRSLLLCFEFLVFTSQRILVALLSALAFDWEAQPDDNEALMSEEFQILPDESSLKFREIFQCSPLRRSFI
jgi:hypothetical protein